MNIPVPSLAEYLAREYETATPQEIAAALNEPAHRLPFSRLVRSRTAHEMATRRTIPDPELIRLMRKRIGLQAEEAA